MSRWWRLRQHIGWRIWLLTGRSIPGYFNDAEVVTPWCELCGGRNVMLWPDGRWSYGPDEWHLRVERYDGPCPRPRWRHARERYIRRYGALAWRMRSWS